MEQSGIPAAGFLLCEVAERYGIAAEEIFRDADLKRAVLQSKSVRLTHTQITEAAERACRLTGEPGLGFPLGLLLRQQIHRFVFGSAAIFAQTIRDSLQLFLQLGRLQRLIHAPVLCEDGENAALVFHGQGEQGAAQDVILICMLTAFAQAADDIAGDYPIERVDLTIAEPAYVSRFAQLPITRKLRFGQAQNRVFGRARFLDLHVGDIQASDVERINAQCERELENLGCADLRRRVLTLLQTAPEDIPSLDAAAVRLGVSPRTLKRQLAGLGTSFSILRDQVIRARAEQLLLRDDDRLEQVAERLGLSDAPSFIRAFRRWTGLTPARYRALRR